MKRILVVDPTASIRRLVAAIFAGVYEVVEAADGETALGHVYADRPDLVLAELVIPDVSGLEIARLIRKDPDLRRMRLVAVTGSLDPMVQRYALDAGYDAFVTKPFRPSVLRALVDAFFADDASEGRAIG